MGSDSREGTRRTARVVASMLITLVLVGCGGLGLLPRQTDVKNTTFKNYHAVEVAYQQVMPGATRASDLGQMGFERTTVSYGWSAEVMLLIQDGRVAYKVMAGHPNIQNFQDKVQPLGPLQDLGDEMVHTASRF